MGKCIIRIAEQSVQDLRLAGGKGASLSRLMGIDGISVPDGYIVTSEAYKSFVEPVIRPFADKLRSMGNNPASVSSDIKAAINGLTLSPGFEAELKNALGTMGDSALLAVRSSATAEDLPDASFAGQQDTFLNVQGYGDVKAAIISCFASLYNERAIAYRAKNRFDENDVSMAVVLQKMVPSQVSGVMFTADPMTSDRLTTVIEAVEGLGEELVSGRKTPATWHIKNAEIRQIDTSAPPLNESQIKELVSIGKKIEEAYGQPQDIEWCFSGGKFYVVQSRPITTLFPCPPSKDGFKRCFISVGHIQMMTDTILPLGMSFWGMMSPDVSIVAAGGRMFMDVTHNLQSQIGMRLVRQKVSNSDELMDDAMTRVYERKSYIKLIPKGKGSQFAIPKTIVSALMAGWKAYRTNDTALIDAYVRRSEASIEKARIALTGLSGKAALEYIRADMSVLMKDLMEPAGLGPLLVSFYQTKSIDKAGKELLGKDKISDAISKWLLINITSEMGVAVSRIADAARDYPEVARYLETAGDSFSLDELRKLPGTAAVEFEMFCDKYGMRCPGEIDIAKPRFIEEPSKIIASVLAEIKLPKGYAAERFKQGKRESDEAVKALVAAAKEKWGAKKAKKLEKQLSFYRNFTGLRESPKYFWMKRYWVYRQAILRAADGLVRDGKLRRVDDAYYLTLNQLTSLFDGGFKPDYARIDSLRGDYEHWAALTPPRLIFSDGEVVTGEYKRRVPEGALPGLAVSSGIVEGRARVILDIKDAHRIEKGDILVTRFTDPSWTPAFMSIAALVTEIGGVATHGAVITREYGLPAVVGVVGAAKLINDGQRIRVNGTHGYIELL